MAYGMRSTNIQYLTGNSNVSWSLSPMTLACWARPYTNTQPAGSANILVCVQQANTAQRNQISFLTPNFVCQANQVGATTNGNADGTVGTTANTWTHYAGVFNSSTSRISYISGGNPVTNTTNIGTQLDGNIVRIGTRFTTSLGIYCNADVCEVGVWTSALTASEISSLSRGVACNKIRPQNLAFYAPLVRDLIDYRGGIIISNTNSCPVTPHTRLYI